MVVRFFGNGPSGGFQVEYAWGNLPIPTVGQTVHADGDDPDFPEGDYTVTDLEWRIGLRGPRIVNIDLQSTKHPAPGASADG